MNVGKEIQNFFQNLFKQRNKWRRKAAELDKYYDAHAPHATNNRKMIVCMFDGRTEHCGITDRLRGIVSTYDVCMSLGYDFRIYFVVPFALEDYLAPHHVQWHTDAAELCYNNKDSQVMYCGSNGTYVEPYFQRKWFVKCFRNARKQLHVYTNANLLPRGERFGQLFNELFKPTALVEKAIADVIETFNGDYYTVSLRFQRLLGDFVERDGVDITPQEQQMLMKRCIKKIDEIHQRQHIATHCVLMSDSTRFLNFAVQQLDYVTFVPGDTMHIDFYKSTPQDVNVKLFADMLIISRARQAFLLQSGEMYNSGFPRRAAQIGNVPFKYIRF